MRALSAAATMCLAVLASPVLAAQIDIVGPADSGAFGTSVTVLPNGNIVVTDPDAGASKTGAVYLYDPDRHLISRLSGSSPNDRVGSDGIIVLASGNFVVCSPDWSNAAAPDAGAATWVDGRTGLSGVVSARNSLVGTTVGDRVGFANRIVALSNGNYVVASPDWSNGVTHDAGSGIGIVGGGDFGAVTWGSGTSGVAGAVSTANSLVGTTKRDHVGESVTALRNGNYVVASPEWGNGIERGAFGAVTWADGTTGLRGPVSTRNSLVGAVAGDEVGVGYFGSGAITALSNGNYVVVSSSWNDSAGAATWGNGASGTTGLISAANSLIGTTAGDSIGSDGIIALSNGNYVVASSAWSDGVPRRPFGAVTWGDGTSGTAGPVSASNSLVGTGADTAPPGSIVIYFNVAVTPLSNGNYVVASPYWNNGLPHDLTDLLGAATWGNGKRGTSGVISSSNSLVGTANGVHVGAGGVVALSNGSYVVASPSDVFTFYGAVPRTGAATWANGNTGTTGFVSPSNSLMGAIAQVTALTNGNYVVTSNGATGALMGAVTWGNGATGTVGLVSADNSRVGLAPNTFPGDVTALSNGNYVLDNLWWNEGNPSHRLGAVTWGNGAAPTTGTISPANSLIGTEPGDQVGSGGIVALSDGRYVVVTLPHGPSNFSDDVAFAAQPGSVTLVDGRFGAAGTFRSSATVIGGRAHSYDPARQQLVVGRPQDNIVTLLTLPTHEEAGHSRRPMPPALLGPRANAGQ